MSNLWYELTDEDDMEIPWDKHNPFIDDDEDEKKEWDEEDDTTWDEEEDLEELEY